MAQLLSSSENCQPCLFVTLTASEGALVCSFLAGGLCKCQTRTRRRWVTEAAWG